MNFTNQKPDTALKAAFLQLIKYGCAESEFDPPFENGDADEEWSFVDEDDDTPFPDPAWQVRQEGDSVMVAENCAAVVSIPIVIRLYAPHGATKEWLRACVDVMYGLLTEAYHEREVPRPADRTPLAYRLTSAAQEMDDPQPLWVHSTSIPEYRPFATLGESIIAEFQIEVVCGMYEE